MRGGVPSVVLALACSASSLALGQQAPPPPPSAAPPTAPSAAPPATSAPSLPPPAPSAPPAAASYRAPAPPTPAPASSSDPIVVIEADNAHVALERRIGSLQASDFAPGHGYSPGGAPPPGSPPPAYSPTSEYGPYWEPDWERVCATPCLRPVAIGGVYRIAGPGVTPSDAFRLHAPRTDLKVSAGSASARTLGGYMSVFGFLVAAAGGVFLVMSAVSHADIGQTENRVAGIISGVAVGAGVLVGVTGIVLFVSNGTTVRDASGKAVASRGR